MPDLASIGVSASQWVGREERAEDEVTGQAARRLAATLDLPAQGFAHGTELPEGWHVILFPPLAPTSGLGRDGHPQTGEFLPALPLPRRMFASRRVVFHQPLLIGDAVTRVSRIEDVVPKEGRSGLLAFVKVVHDFVGPRGLAVTEEQQIVYREDPKGTAPTQAPPVHPLEADYTWHMGYTPDAALLFRYSAVTFNGHRIHYDNDYARDVEGYPDRVVNGGLTAIMMLKFARQVRPGRLSEFSVRNKKPLFVDRPVRIWGRPTGEATAEFIAVDGDGAECAQAQLVWGPAQ